MKGYFFTDYELEKKLHGLNVVYDNLKNVVSELSNEDVDERVTDEICKAMDLITYTLEILDQGEKTDQCIALEWQKEYTEHVDEHFRKALRNGVGS